MRLIDKLTIGSLCSGVGGLELGLEWTGGFKTRWQCEIEPFRRKILQNKWSDVPCYEDVKEVCRTIHPEKPYVICGGFPCQPFSHAGSRRGEEDERHLWPEFLRIVKGLRPSYLIAENVPGLLTIDSGRAFGRILSDLATIGYAVEWETLSAATFGAIHCRDRVFIVAYPDGCGRVLKNIPVFSGKERFKEYLPVRLLPIVPDADDDRRPRDEETWQRKRYVKGRGWWETEPGMVRVVHGVSRKLDQARVEALGNAVVPQCATFVGNCILRRERLMYGTQSPERRQ